MILAKSSGKLLSDLMRGLSGQGVDTEQVMVCFKETSWENWSFGGELNSTPFADSSAATAPTSGPRALNRVTISSSPTATTNGGPPE